jgi:hypothetical protein
VQVAPAEDSSASSAIIPVAVNPASAASMSAECSSRRPRPSGSRRASHAFQTPVTVLTVKRVATPAASGPCALRAHSGAASPRRMSWSPA